MRSGLGTGGGAVRRRFRMKDIFCVISQYGA